MQAKSMQAKSMLACGFVHVEHGDVATDLKSYSHPSGR